MTTGVQRKIKTELNEPQNSGCCSASTLIQVVALAAIGTGAYFGIQAGALSATHITPAFISGVVALALFATFFFLYQSAKRKKEREEEMRKAGEIVIHKKAWYQTYEAKITLVAVSLLIIFGSLFAITSVREFFVRHGMSIGVTSSLAVGSVIFFNLVKGLCTPNPEKRKMPSPPPSPPQRPFDPKLDKREKMDAIRTINAVRTMHLQHPAPTLIII